MAEKTGHILFVCTANTCRSPMAAALFRHALAIEPEPLKSLEVASAGVSALTGYPAANNAIEAMRKVGVCLTNHRSQRVTQDLLDRSLAVFCMTEAHRAMLGLQFEPVPQRLHLMREFVEDPDRDIPDPFGLNLAAYEASRDSMLDAIPSLVAYVRSLLVPGAA